MKTGLKTLALLLVLAFVGAGCTTVTRLNTEYEEEMTRIESLSPEEKAAFEKDKHEEEQVEMNEIYRDSE
ncbi:MAG TPA: hypothetical protein VH985_06140 [Candidatus Binatia bacterium]|jgi:hypothetical protein